MQLVAKEIEEYCRIHTTSLPAAFDRLREETYAKLEMPQMQVGLLEGRFLGMLVAITNAKSVLEVGTFTGFSALAMASALPEDGKLITCDVSEVSTEIAKRHWADSPHGKKIEFRMGPAATTIDTLSGPFDLVFLDADKGNYKTYWEKSLPKLRRGGLLVVDNVLWSGRVLNPQEQSDHDIVAFNKHAAKDPRVEIVMLPVRDGIMLARKL
jgi:caffeoyl-CoA O-methyltransferase